MRIKDLLNIWKSIVVKENQLRNTKRELEKLREEIEMITSTIDINSDHYKQEDLIYVGNMYLFRDKSSNITHFVQRIEYETFHYELVDIYTGEKVARFTLYGLMDAVNGINKSCYCQSINEFFPITQVYVDGKVPKILIQKLYYEVNNIDNKVLKIGVMQV